MEERLYNELLIRVAEFSIWEVFGLKKLMISLENCFGINKLNCELDFSNCFPNCNAYTIYARNGMMKTSFSNTFQYIQDGKDEKIWGVSRVLCKSIQ